MKKFIAMFTIASSVFAVDVCTIITEGSYPIAKSTEKMALTSVMCTNAKENATYAIKFTETPGSYLGHAYAEGRNNAVKALMEKGYKSIDSITFVK